MTAEQGYGLALHTSSPDFGLAVGFGNGVELEALRWQTWALGRDLSTQLHGTLAAFLTPQGWQDLRFLAVATGPGGFTGTRLGVVTARTLAQQLAIPLFGISSLGAIAHHTYRTRPTPDAVAIALPAQRGQLHTALFSWHDGQLHTELPDTVRTPEEWEAVLASYPRPHTPLLVDGGFGHTTPDILQLAYQRWQQGDPGSWETVIPYYGQHPVQM